MTDNHVLSMLQGCVGIRGYYTNTKYASENTPKTEYTFKAPKDHIVTIDDFVVVPNKGAGYSVIKVTAIDVPLTTQSDWEYKWIVGPIDLTSYNKLIKQEERLQEIIKRSREVEELKRATASLLEHMTDADRAELNAITKLGLIHEST